MRRVMLVLFLIGAIVGPRSSAIAQRRTPGDSLQDDGRITTEIDRAIQQAMNEAQLAIKNQQFVLAVNRLQSVLDHPEDYFLRKDFRANNHQIPGVKAQTHRILAELPAEGRAVYEQQYGPTARAMLADALATNDIGKTREIVRRYQMTAAGFEALQILIASALDHDHLIEAALMCEQSALRFSAVDPLGARWMLRAAYSWHLAGQPDRSVAVLKSLKMPGVQQAWQVGGRSIAPYREGQDAKEWLTAQFGKPISRPIRVVRDWNFPRGGDSGNESATAAYPIGGGVWRISPLRDARIWLDDQTNRLNKLEFEKQTREVEKLLRDDHRLTAPASIPIVSGHTVVYRTLNDLTAVHAQTGELLWRSSITDGMIAWLLQSSTATSDLLPASSPITLKGYLRHKLFRDQLSNSLTSDGKLVYAIEESDSQFNPLRPRARQPFGMPFIGDPANKLVAYDLSGGRIVWEVGGMRGTQPVDLSGLFFLGPPLPYDGRLYCLAEVKNEIRLLALVPAQSSAELDWSQALVNISEPNWIGAGRRNILPIIGAPRRVAGLTPAIADGIMVCGTASGSVIGYDVVQRQLCWGYSYESTKTRMIQEGFESITAFQVDEEEGRWLDNTPIIANGRVVLTPRDSNELICLNLIDGTPVWKRPRDNGLYVALIHDGKVIVVGRSQIMAYSIADGSDAWPVPLEIPEPSGRGVREGSRYLLPLSTGEIATLDVAAGRILGRSRLPAPWMPGNLAVASGTLVSCGIHDVVGFRKLNDVEQQIAQRLAANPYDAEALAMRGELALHRGNESNAIQDLRESLRQQPQLRVKQILAETMLAVLKNDSSKILQAAPELEKLTDDPRQRIEFLHLYARALGEAGDRVGAAQQLFRLAEIPELPDEPNQAAAGHFLSIPQSLRSQLFTIYQQASRAERLELDRLFLRQFESATAVKDRKQQLERFVKLTVGHPAADPLLRHLVESQNDLLDEAARTGLLERLTHSSSVSIGAFAVATLAKQSLSGGRPTEALPWIEQLGRNFPLETCEVGKTGRWLSHEWLAREDVRNAKVSPAAWPGGPIEVAPPKRRSPSAAAPIEIVTHVGSHFEGWSFELDQSAFGIIARDPSLKVAWQLPLQDFTDNPRVQSAQLHIRDRTLAFSAGMSLVVMRSADPFAPPTTTATISLRSNALGDRRVNQILVERRLLPNGRRFQSAFDIRGSAGFLVGLSDEAVFYQLDNRLVAADIETGRILWYRVGPAFSKSSATVDTHLVLHTANNECLLLRPMDGVLQQRHTAGLDEMPLCFRETWRLSQRSEGQDQQVLEMRDFDGDKVIWQRQYPSGTVTNVVADNQLALLEPSGKLSLLSLATGEPKLTAQAPVKRPIGTGGVLAVQDYDDRYIVVAGVSPKKTDLRTVTTLDFGPSNDSSFTVDGHAFAIRKTDGQILWSVPVEQSAFDFSQPSKYPVLVLASRHSEVDPLGAFSRMPRLSTLILDKRTGAKVDERQETLMAINRGPQLIPLPDEKKLIVDYQAWSLELSFPGEAKPKE